MSANEACDAKGRVEPASDNG